LPSITGLAASGPIGTEAQHCSAVGDDTDQIAAGRERTDFKRIGNDFFAGGCYPGRVGKGKILLVGQCLGRHHRNLARVRLAVIFQCSAANVFVHDEQQLLRSSGFACA
jgi:hypothetical protein